MKVLHVCLAAFYIDDFGYQENILPKMHKLQGHDVAVLASTETYVGTNIGHIKPSSYLSKDNIPITRIPYVKWLPHKVATKLRIYIGISDYLKMFKPDIIFLHDCQFISIYKVVEYVKKNKDVRVYADGHTDYINSAKTWLSRNILHKIIYRWCVQLIEPYTIKFYGTLPLRVDFFKDVYKTPPEKTELLRLGIDTTEINFLKRDVIRESTRKKLGLDENDFVIVTGGKLDKRKNIHVLIKAINKLRISNIHLIVFGKPDEEMQAEIMKLVNSPQIHFVGWIPPDQTVNYFFAADIACFPGTHSVLWEESVGLGTPAIFKRWKGIEHIDLNGNCILIENVNIDTIQKSILTIYNNPELLKKMKLIAINKGIEMFSYYEIAEKAIRN